MRTPSFSHPRKGAVAEGLKPAPGVSRIEYCRGRACDRAHLLVEAKEGLEPKAGAEGCVKQGDEASVVLKLGFTPVPMVLRLCLPCGAARRPRSLAGPPLPPRGQGCARDGQK